MFFEHSLLQEAVAEVVDTLVIKPGDPRYDEARQAWNLSVDQYPAAIVMAESAEDVVAAIRYARQENLGVSVQATGHGVFRPANGTLLINTSRMTEVTIYPETGTAWVAAGAKWQPVLDKAQAFGLAPLLGSTPDVGAVGYTLGGGLGWLARKYGLSSDSVLRFEVVTADGEIRQVSKTEHPDLFWALRGGGGSMAVVTGMEIQLYPVTVVYGGNLIYPITLAREVFLRYRAWVETLPNEFTTSVALMNFPPIPEVPEFLRGQSVVMVRGCYTGDVAEGKALLQPWLDWRQPMAHLFSELPFTEVASISNDPLDPMAHKLSGMRLRALSDEVIDTLLEHGINDDGSNLLVMIEVRHAGGVMSQVTSQSSPIGHRNVPFVLAVIAAVPIPALDAPAEAQVNALIAALEPARVGVYMNFLEGSESQKRTIEAYSLENYHWLMRIKAKYDPHQLFRHGINIPPKQ